MKPLLIYNPTAGKGNAGKTLPQVEEMLQQRNFEYDLLLTDSVGCAQREAARAVTDFRPLVIAAGGDGTVNETINGMMLARNGGPLPVLGVLPVGRGNDFAFGLGIPHDLEVAVDAVTNGRQLTIDIGRVSGGDYPDGRFFGNGVGLGFDTVVGFEAARITWATGAASYLAALIKTIFLYAKAPVYEVALDDAKFHKPYLMISIMNGRRMGGSFLMAPDGDPGDGRFHLCMVEQVPQWRILPLATTFFSGTQGKDKAVLITTTSSISVRATQGSIPAHADGETICTAGQSLKVELIPCALQVMVPQEGAQA